MKITKTKLKQIIREETENVLKEQHFDPNTGAPITDKGRQIDKELVEQAIKAEELCFKWANENRKEELLKHHRSKKIGVGAAVPENILNECPHKASDEAHRRLNFYREKKSPVLNKYRQRLASRGLGVKK